MNFEYLLKQLKANIFLPKEDSPTKLPDKERTSTFRKELYNLRNYTHIK
ncbi:hypothetical protein [Clostridium intestinale]|uniref:Uncharacterized protein n=1 Tax=Clostridium intestinale DSM 6191 TaxID=1121320 RepID=A0A1M5T1S6_9CLOT|nr:hypothetical protein [Clostridium intestinale]SHH44665.1 hypothetical protein SAMN02745941_00081 [Clostridium intestinale DSM 6191]